MSPSELQAKRHRSAKRKLFGARSPRNSLDPSTVLESTRLDYLKLKSGFAVRAYTTTELREAFAPFLRSYYTLAAGSRRKYLPPGTREAMEKILFPFRSLIETRIRECLIRSFSFEEIVNLCAVDSFFGRSKKQGVSIRYALSSCVPTLTCGAACYAHDGRDRDGLIVVRGAMNWCLGTLYETGSSQQRAQIIAALDNPIRKAVQFALNDAHSSCSEGFTRAPRIRFSHVGEMAATPTFANALAGCIKKYEPNIACVLYTRHPQARQLDPDLLFINFTLESDEDARRDYAPNDARLVASSWDGRLSNSVQVNFLEHHGNSHAEPIGNGYACPVTTGKKISNCDDARCDLCFQNPKQTY